LLWLFHWFIGCVRRELAVYAALLEASLRREDQRLLEKLESGGIDVSAARALLAALDAEDAPKPIALPTNKPVTPPPALPAPSTKRAPDQPKKPAGPGAPFRSSKPAH
jgi:hypothetical protein